MLRCLQRKEDPLMTHDGGSREGRGRLFWLTAVALSGAGSVAAVRLATPLTLDDKPAVVLLYFLLPGAFILALGKLFRPIGLSLAAVIPFAWLLVTRDAGDGLSLWLIPVLASGAILLAARFSRRQGFGWKHAAAAVAIAASTVLWPTVIHPKPDLRAVLIGWDGATWSVVDRLVKEGKMPNFARLAKDGHRAKLRSLPSLLSPQIWTTISTGCLPEVHGIMGWTNRQSDLHVGRIWDQLKKEGRSYGLCDWYFTWPPIPGDEERDFIIPTHLAPTSVTFPEDYSFYRVLEDLQKLREIEEVPNGARILASAGLEAWRHGIRLSTFRRGFEEVLMRKLGRRDKLDLKWRNYWFYTLIESDLIAELLRTRRPEFAAVLFNQIDGVSHLYWKYMAPEGFDEVTEQEIDLYGNVIPDIYAETDRGLGEILKFVPPEADVMIVSDHGFEALGDKIAGKSCRIRTLKLIAALGLDGKMFGTNVGKQVYLWAIAGTREEKEGILSLAEPMLRETRVEGESNPFFDVSRVDESIHLSIAPRPDVPEESYILFDDRRMDFKRLVRAAGIAFESGTHNPDGIYLLSGPSARRAVKADSLNVVDVAPTMAAILGLPFSPLWTGHPAIEVSSMRIATADDYPPPAGQGEEPERVTEDLIERLRALGYLE